MTKSLQDLLHAVHAFKQRIDRPPKAVDSPETDAAEAVLPHQSESCADASRVLEPDHMPPSGGVGIVEVRRLGRLVVTDLGPAGGGELLRARIGEDACRRPLLPRQDPVIGVVGKSHEDLSRGHDRDGIVQHAADAVDGRHRLRRAEGIAPLISLGVSRTQSKKKALNIPENHIIMMAKCLFLP